MVVYRIFNKYTDISAGRRMMGRGSQVNAELSIYSYGLHDERGQIKSAWQQVASCQDSRGILVLGFATILEN